MSRNKSLNRWRGQYNILKKKNGKNLFGNLILELIPMISEWIQSKTFPELKIMKSQYTEVNSQRRLLQERWQVCLLFLNLNVAFYYKKASRLEILVIDE